MTVIVSEYVTRLAQETVRLNVVLKDSRRFEVLKLAPGRLDHLALLLFKPGFDLEAESELLVKHLVIPVTVEGRKGYMVLESAALTYDAEAHDAT